MKKILIMAVAALLAVACAAPSLADRFEKFTEKVEKDCSEYTSEDWEKCEESLEELCAEYEKCAEELTEEETDRIEDSIRRVMKATIKEAFSGKRMKHAIDQAGKALEVAGEAIEEAFEESGDAIEDAMDETEKTLNDLFE